MFFGNSTVSSIVIYQLETSEHPKEVGKWHNLTYEVSQSIFSYLDVNFACNPPSPPKFPGPLTPPPPWNVQFPPWWGYGYFLELQNLGCVWA